MKLAITALGLALSTLSLGCSSDADDPAPAPATAKSDIVDTAAGAGQFDTLVAAVQAADLEATLRSPGPFTVFAPTDDAFAGLPAGTVESLLMPENKPMLTTLLTYHVVAGRLTAAEVSGKTSVTTVEGRELPISVSGGEVRVGAAKVIAADVAAKNGVIHVIDAVLVPN